MRETLFTFPMLHALLRMRKWMFWLATLLVIAAPLELVGAFFVPAVETPFGDFLGVYMGLIGASCGALGVGLFIYAFALSGLEDPSVRVAALERAIAARLRWWRFASIMAFLTTTAAVVLTVMANAQ